MPENTVIKQNGAELHFEALPAYADFLLKEHLEAFCQYQIRLFKEQKLSLLRTLSHLSDAELLQLTIHSNTGLLTHLAGNEAHTHIENNLKWWRENAPQDLDIQSIVVEDITTLSYLRKQVLLHFLPLYCTDATSLLKIVSEIDLFLLKSETAFIHVQAALLQEDLGNKALLLEKINNTLPGAIYVFDVVQYKSVYSNNHVAAVIGYTQEELNALGENAISKLLHPDDKAGMEQHLEAVRQLADGETRSYKYRVRGKDGAYHWIRNYEAPFKRCNDGKVWQTIGISLNIDIEEKLAETLEEREAQYKKAETLANVGHYSYDMATKQVEWTDQLYRIYGLQPQGEPITLERFFAFIHPDDRAAVLKEKDRLFEAKKLNYTFRIIAADGQEKTLRSIAEVQEEAHGNAVKVIGTEQDITEKQGLIEQLQRSEALYKQAQALAHIGNWTWHLETGAVEWSDELYRIYELPIGENVTYDSIAALTHPGERADVQNALQHCIETKTTYDKYHRIVLKSGKIKVIHRRAEVVTDGSGKVVKIVGTTQDVTERQRLISQLEQSDKLYKQAQEIAHIGNWVLDVTTGRVTWSDELYKMMGLQPQSEALTWDGLLKNIPPEDQEQASAAFEKAWATAAPFELYHSVLLDDGSERTLHIRGEAVAGADGRVAQLIGTAQDVTHQKQTEHELRENQTFIRKITDATPSIIALHNVHTGKYEFINAGLKKLLDYDPEEVYRRGAAFFFEIVHPEDLEPLMKKNAAVLSESNKPENRTNNQVVAEFTYRMRHKNGTYRWIQTYGTIFGRDADGVVEEVLNISLDITDRIEAQKTIEAQEHFIRHIADASPTILYLFDVAKGSFSYINREIYYVLGYTMEEVIAMGADATKTLYHPDDFALLPERNVSPKVFQHPDSMMQYECRLRNKEGHWCWLLVREVIFETDDNGNILQILGAALDITKRKAMEKTLLQNSMLLEQSNASLEEFAYVASHDLKEPLRKIATFGDRLLTTQQEKLTDDGKVYLKKIIDASQRMQVMINDLLSISMITGDRSFQRFSLQAVLDEVLQTLEYKIEQKQAAIESDGLPEAQVVPSQFRQLFQNLISNSLKFVREDARPHIRITHQYLAPEEVRHLSGAPHYLKLEFKDNGIGFEEEYAGKIFAIFQRLHGRSEYEGTGIGLAICKKIVEHHGGVIYANATPGKGATFTIILPA